MNQNGVANPGNLGNAYQWANNAFSKGIRVDQTPAVGSIAQWNTTANGATGHVAYVESVSPSGIVITEDNFMPSTGVWAGGYTASISVSATSNAWPDNFIHFKDMAAPVTGGSGPITTPSGSRQSSTMVQRPSGETDITAVSTSGALMFFYNAPGQPTWYNQTIANGPFQGQPSMVQRPSGETDITAVSQSGALLWFFNEPGQPTWYNQTIANGPFV